MEFDGTLGRHPRDYGWSERIENTEDGFMMRCSCEILDMNEFINVVWIFWKKKSKFFNQSKMLDINEFIIFLLNFEEKKYIL